MTYDPERVVRNALLLRGANEDARLAERWRNFPTEEQIEAAIDAVHDATRKPGHSNADIALAVLEAVALDPKERNE
jgi:hypothetical protein